jgi:hypothetical protein
MERADLLGSWRLAPDDLAARRRYGEHALEITPHGDLVQSTVIDGGLARVLLTWRLDVDELVTDQPSAPKLERSKVVLLPDGQLLMGSGAEASRYVRDTPASALDPDAQLYALAGTALRHGVASAHSGGPFVPFLMTQNDEAMQLYRIVDKSPELAERAGRSQAGQLLGVKLCAWTYDGLVTVDEEKTDAAFAQVSVRGRRDAKVLALRYRFGPEGTAVAFGGFLVAGEAEGWLR